MVLTTATFGEEAIALVATTRPDLVFMDIGLSGTIDGIEATRQIRVNAPVPMVFLSAHVNARAKTHMETGAPTAFIAKPFSEAELRHVNQTLLGQ